jgi:hypothetical protein
MLTPAMLIVAGQAVGLAGKLQPPMGLLAQPMRVLQVETMLAATLTAAAVVVALVRLAQTALVLILATAVTVSHHLLPALV